MSKLYNNYVKSYYVSPETAADFFELVGDIYFSEQLQSQKQYDQHSSINRLDHITSVSYLTYLYAIKKGYDVNTATRAAVLHDLVYYDWHDHDWSHRPHGFRHPGFAAKNASELDPQFSEKEKYIILRHMWPLTVIPPKSKEGWLVSLIDKYCATNEMLRAENKYFSKKFNAVSKKLGVIKNV